LRILAISNLYPPVVRGCYELICADAVNGLCRQHEVVVLTSRSEETAASEPNVIRELDLLELGRHGTLTAPLAAMRATQTVRARLASFQPDLVFVWNGAQIPQTAIRIAQEFGRPDLQRGRALVSECCIGAISSSASCCRVSAG
jgi:hypothetical protein